MKDDDRAVKLELAGILYGIFGDDDATLMINRVEIHRFPFTKKVYRITIYTSRPGLIIGKGGEKIKEIVRQLKLWRGGEIGIKIIEHEVLPILSFYGGDY